MSYVIIITVMLGSSIVATELPQQYRNRKSCDDAALRLAKAHDVPTGGMVSWRCQEAKQ